MTASLLFFAVFLNLEFNLASRTDFAAPVDFSPTDQGNAWRWNPRLFQILSFGELPAAVDSIWIHTLQDSSIAHVRPGTHPESYYDLDLATTLDAAYFDAYVAGASVLAVVRNDGAGARDLLLKGEHFRQFELPGYGEAFEQAFWRNAWNVPMLLGYTYLFELKDLPDAAIYFRRAGELPNAPAYLQQMSARLAQPGGEYEVGMRLLNFLLLQAKSDDEKAAIQAKRHSLFLGQFLFHANLDFTHYLENLPEYRASPAVARRQLAKYWARFVKESRMGTTDPFGGRLSLSSSGRVVSSTPHEAIFGLE